VLRYELEADSRLAKSEVFEEELELEEEVEILRRRVRELEEENNQLRERVKKLEERIVCLKNIIKALKRQGQGR